MSARSTARSAWRFPAAFQEVVPFRFGIDDPAQHYHLPLKFTPWGFTLFRGGA